MKKHAILIVLIVSCIFQSSGAQENVVSEPKGKGSKSTAWLLWFKSLRMPTKADITKVQEYLHSKWRCVRYGEHCSRKERATLGALSVLVAAAVGTGAYLLHKKLKPVDKKQKLAEELIDAVTSNNILKVEALLQQGVDPNTRDKYGRTMVGLVAIDPEIDLAILEKLLKGGADPNLQPAGDADLLAALLVRIKPPLLIAVDQAIMGYNRDRGHLVVKKLLESGKLDLNAHNQGVGALIEAIDMGRLDLIYMLLVAGADLKDAMELRGEAWGVDMVLDTLFYFFQEDRNAISTLINERNYNPIIEHLRELLRADIGPMEYETFSRGTFSPESSVSLLPREVKGKIFEYVTEQELTPEQRDKLMAKVERPERAGKDLIKAIQYNNFSEVKRLLQNGANPDSVDKYGRTMVGLAVEFGHPVVLEELLKAGADPNLSTRVKLRSIFKKKPLIRAVELAVDKVDYNLMVRKLLESDRIDLRIRDQGIESLATALAMERPDLTYMLLAAGVDLGKTIDAYYGKRPTRWVGQVRVERSPWKGLMHMLQVKVGTQESSNFKRLIDQGKYEEIMRRLRGIVGKQEYEVFADTSRAQSLPAGVRGKIFEYLTEQTLAPDELIKK